LAAAGDSRRPRRGGPVHVRIDARSARGAKTWGSLCRGARTFAATFDIRPGAWTLAGTVSPQHMFGLEATVMAALRTGCALDATRPRFGKDLAALARANAQAKAPPLCLATTPLHLEHFQRSPGPPPAVHRIIVSTMPMSRALAGDVERHWHARVDEIYGSTECGMIAARRPARDDAFTLGEGLSLAIDADGSAVASGAQLDAPVALDDRLAWRDEARRAFALEGRKGDMVKVAGSAPRSRRWAITCDASTASRTARSSRAPCSRAGSARWSSRPRSTRSRCVAGSPSGSTRRSCRGR
jgi:hypothetical protein